MAGKPVCCCWDALVSTRVIAFSFLVMSVLAALGAFGEASIVASAAQFVYMFTQGLLLLLALHSNHALLLTIIATLHGFYAVVVSIALVVAPQHIVEGSLLGSAFEFLADDESSPLWLGVAMAVCALALNAWLVFVFIKARDMLTASQSMAQLASKEEGRASSNSIAIQQYK